MSDATVSTGFSKDDVKRINSLLRETPVAALEGGMMFRPVTDVDGVIAQLTSIVTFLRAEMNQHQDTRDELDALKRDLKAAGRIFNLIKGEDAAKPSAQDAFKSVYAAMAIRHEFTLGDLKDMARDHGINL